MKPKYRTKTLGIRVALLASLTALTACDQLIQRKPSAANPEQAAKTAYLMCAGCHGPKDVRVDLMSPYLWGQKEKHLVKSLTAYRDKTRIHPVMNSLAEGFSDEDIANLSHYIASQPWQP